MEEVCGGNLANKSNLVCNVIWTKWKTVNIVT